VGDSILVDSLKKKLSHIPDPNPEKGHVLHLDNGKPHLADHQIQANNLTQSSHPPYSPELAPTDFWLFGDLKIILKGSSFEMAD
jgi:hypothetical protein